ncbi:MAG: TatD family hydrolase [Candidatus Aenigmarchaeota archaeon]|nr:TatD family hydrolase [Candidatus Aenigmarchaeota archaeon]
MIDSHCHLHCINDIDAVIGEAKEKGMKAIVTSALDTGEAEKALVLRERYPGFVFVCLGLHPSDIDKFTDEQLEDYTGFIRKNRENIVAVGEVGLDYNWVTDKNRQEKSKEIFSRMIELAHSLRLPLVIHSRNGSDGKSAISDTIKILKVYNAKRVMMHCFSGNESNLKDALDLDYYISYATNICWTKKHPYLAEKTPLDQMLLETDSPWLDPDSPLDKRELNNRPWKVEKSAEKIAEVKGITKEEVLQATTENAERFFRLEV